MKTFKYLLLTLLTLLFISCSSTATVQYSNHSNTMYLGDKKAPVKVEFTNPNYMGHFHRCANFPYTIKDKHKKYGKLFVESISLHSNCFWNGSPLSLLEGKIGISSEVKSMKTVEQITVGNYVLKTYLVNDKKYLSIIYNYGRGHTFIVDDMGILYSLVAKSYDKNYEDRYSFKPRYTSNYNKSMVRDNMIHQYFEREPFVVD